MSKDYKKLYEEALERAKDLHDNHPLGQPQTWITCEKIFPELKEPEDERIRKELLLDIPKVFPHDKAFRYIAWLEKQKSVEPDTETRDIWEYIKEWTDKFGNLPKDADELAACVYYVMQRQKPVEWSEENEKMLQSIISDSEKYLAMLPKQINWLKSIKPNHWKPSEQNIKDLEWCADLVQDKMSVGFHRLQVFIDEIKKL